LNNLFPLNKKNKVQYSILNVDTLKDHAIGLWQNVEKYPNYSKDFGCPAVNSVTNRIYYVNSPFTIEVKFGLNNNNEPYYTYEYDTNVHPISDAIKELLEIIFHVEVNNNRPTFQVLLPYGFITDNDITLTTIGPNIMSKNVVYVPGSLNIKNWIRNVNSAWTLEDVKQEGVLYFDINKPIIQYIFDKPVDLKYAEITDKQNKYYLQSKGLLNFKLNISNAYKYIIKRRPKKLLWLNYNIQLK